MDTTVAWRVLRSPELLSLIFCCMDKANNAACAIVCRAWLNPSLNELWRCIHGPLILLKLLAPMHKTDDSCGTSRWLFSRFVLPSDWLRFEFYAWRIRRLNYCEPDGPPIIDASVFAEVARTRPTITLLPHLQHLAWHTKNLNQAILFMHPNLTGLVARIDEPFVAAEGFMEARCFLIEAAVRLPRLTLLDIRASFSVVHVQNALVNLLCGARQLKKVVLPRYWLSSAVISALAPSPCLEVLQWEYIDQGQGDAANVHTFEISACDRPFPALVDLSLEVNIQDAIEFMESSSFPRHLKMFYVRSLRLVPPSDVQRFFTLCSTISHNLTHIYLDLHTNTLEVVPESHYISLATFEPVLSCPTITHLTLTFNAPLSITDADVETFASRWPSMVALYLNDEPLWLETPGLTLAALLSLTEHCPKLEELGLYVDATKPPPSLSVPTPFAQLRILDFGTSPIEDENTVAIFLSRICPFPSSTPLQVVAGVALDPVLQDAIDSEKAHEIEHRSEGWSRVKTYLPMLLTLRAEERSRVSELEKELEDFRSGPQPLQLSPSESPVVSTQPAHLCG
ncbi:hypothetical protein JB92DRAFT_2825031 [Gautieria morchelliformis]|nr:hypothetical protein JB92DRAFT_2825031 [Gautieria morchelliformis]